MIRLPGSAVVLLLSSCLGLGSFGCGGNVCQDSDEHVAECLGADEDIDEEQEVADEDCVDNIEAEAECILDADCEEINSGAVYERCASAP